MKSKPELVKASRINSAAKSVGGAYVVATRNQQLPQEENASAQLAGYPLAEYSCKECATVFHANAGIAAHCITCGSSHVHCSSKEQQTAKAKAKAPTIHADSELCEYTCASCGTINVNHEKIVKAAKSSLHCVVCGHENRFSVKATAELDTMSDDTSIDDMDLVDTSEDALAQDEVDTLDELNLNDDGEIVAQDEVLEDLSLESDEDEMPIADADEMPPPESNQPSVTLSPPVDPPFEDRDPNVEYSEDEMDVNLLESEDDLPVEELSLVWIKDKLAIASATKILATLDEKDAGNNADIMQTAEFASIISHAVEKQGLKAACKDLGFKPVIAKVNIKNVVEAKVKQELANKAKELEDKLEAVASDFNQAAELATAGVVKNFWQNVQDPLKAALVAELATVGLRNPTKLVDRVWEVHASKLLRTILDKAKELSKKSVTARNELAETLDLVKYVPTKVVAETDEDEDDSEEQDEDEDGEDTVESRLSAAAIPVEAGAVQVVAGSKSGGGRSMIRAILAGRDNHFNS